MFLIQKAVFLVVVLKALLLQAALQDLTHTNFLHKGCTIQRTYRDATFADSIFFHMLFPPHTSHFSIDVEQRGIKSQIQLNDIKGLNHQQTWMMMELVLKDKLEVRFRNGSVWLTESHKKKMSREPDKSIRMRGGHFMKDCPEETPNWTLEDGAEDRPLLIGEKEEILSFFPNHPTKIYFTVGQEELVLCWDATSNATVVMSAVFITANCDPLPAFTLFWLQLVYQVPVFMISHPGHSEPLRTFHLDDQGGTVTFRSGSVDGATYVVHHLKGLPRGHVTATTVTSLTDNIKDLCWKVTLPVLTVSVLLLLVSGCLTGIYYQRWTKARKVLYLLRRQDDGRNNHNNSSSRGREVPLPGTPSPPTRPPPSPATHNLYMIPREVKAKSEHMYEDMTWLPNARVGRSHENSAFENTKTEKE